MRENRKHPRKSLHPPSAFQAEAGARVEAHCRDISLGGMFLETKAAAPYGAKVTVFVKLPALKGEAKLEATVRWTSDEGMGVQFSEMGARETHAITELFEVKDDS